MVTEEHRLPVTAGGTMSITEVPVTDNENANAANRSSFDSSWSPPNPGPWMQDRAHTPAPNSRISIELYPDAFTRGFAETTGEYGALVTLGMASVNGYTYHQVQPFDLPGPDGPMSPEQIGAEFGRRIEVAAGAFGGQLWHEHLRLWDNECKPQSLRAHRELNTLDLRSLDANELRAHVEQCAAHLKAMVYQHHRFNMSAMLPVGDFAVQASAWTGLAPSVLFRALEGASPVSSLIPPEMTAAVNALRGDIESCRLIGTVDGNDEAAAQRLTAIAARLPAVSEYLHDTSYRLVDGFDVTRPTLGECPSLVLGKFAAALASDPDAASARAAAFAETVRENLSVDHRVAFDELLGHARACYRLRDERGIYSDISAFGLMRLAMLEVGRRAVASHRLHAVDDVLEADSKELDALLDGSAQPTADELRQRGIDRLALTVVGSPRFLGPPPPEPPPVDQLPPPLARVMSALGFMIDGILGELSEPGGTDTLVNGIAIGNGTYEGRARVARTFLEILELEPGEVLVTPSTGEAMNSMIHLVGAIVTDHGSFASHAAIMARELGFPAVVGTADGSRRIPNGAMVRVNGDTGEVTVLSS